MPEPLSPQLPKPPITLAAIAECTPGATVHGNDAVQVMDLAHPRMITSEQEMVLILEAPALELIKHSPIKVKAAVVAQDITVPEGLLEGCLLYTSPSPRDS